MYTKYVKCVNKDKYTEYTLHVIENDEQVKDSNQNPLHCSAGDRLAEEGFIQEKLRNLTGEILTIIDASMPEGKQQKSVKDLIRKAFIDKHYEVSTALSDQDAIQEMINEMDEEVFDKMEPVSLEEIVGA